MRYIKILVSILVEGIFFLPIIGITFFSRFLRKQIDIGLGPEPLINNVYHKKALEKAGFSAQTFVNQVYFITDTFNIRADLLIKKPFRILRNYYLYCLAIYKYKCLYFYFNGGPLGFTYLLWRIEPFLYKLANVKMVVMPYGGDVDEMSRTKNLVFKSAMSRDYPMHRFRRNRTETQIDMWTKYADHVIGGCDWVEYMYHWDTLMLGHFSIDTEFWKPFERTGEQLSFRERDDLRILHAPNHRNIKGTKYFIDATKELNEEGFNINLIILERVPNSEIRKVMSSVDIVADQLIVGWYAMFALEAMAMEKPVLCFLRDDLINLYTVSGLITKDEIPIINCDPLTVKERIRELALTRDKLEGIGRRSRQFVIKHHSIEYVGKVFENINQSIGLRSCENVR